METFLLILIKHEKVFKGSYVGQQFGNEMIKQKLRHFNVLFFKVLNREQVLRLAFSDHC